MKAKQVFEFERTGDPIKSLNLGVGFVVELQKQPQNKNIEKYRYRLFDQISAGKFKMSIQGGEGSYCSPRRSLPVDEYSSMEIAIFDENDKWVNLTNEDLKKFPRFDELKNYADGDEEPELLVFGYVPVDLIDDLYKYLRNI